MIENFFSEDGRIRVQLYERRDLAAGPLGSASPLQRTVTARAESVEISILVDVLDTDSKYDETRGPAIAVVMSLEEFHALFFSRVFPAVANRMNRIKKPGKK